jgi:murein L,D-transpeptidase YafK
MAVVGALAIAAAALFPGERQTPLPDGVRADKLVVIKSAHRMTLYKDGEPLRTYRVSLGRGGLAPKSREGDALVPEGAYSIDHHVSNSQFHLALYISFPNADDTAAARAHRVGAGSDIEIHGLPNGLGFIGSWHRVLDWTAGCIAVTNSEMDEVWRVVPDGTRVFIRP